MKRNVMGYLAMAVIFGPLAALSPGVEIDDFESYSLGKVDDVASPPWDGITEGTSYATIKAETSSNKYINCSHYTTSGTRGFRNANVGITEGSTKTLFFRLCPFAGNPLDHHLGLVDSTAILDGSDWTSLSSMTTRIGITPGSTSGAKLFWRAPSGGITVLDNASLDTWYNVWLVYYTATDTADMYVNTGTNDATAPGTASQTGMSFYQGGGASGDLVQLAALAYKATGNVGYDDFHMMDGVDLHYPVPLPTGVIIDDGAGPFNQLIADGNDAQFSIVASSPITPIYYRWYYSTDNAVSGDDVALSDGSGISGSATAALSISSASVSREGFYYCKAWNDNPDSEDVSLPASLAIKRTLAYWPMNESNYVAGQYQDIVGSHHATVTGTPSFATGIEGAANGAAVLNQTQNGYATVGAWNPMEVSSQMTISLAVQWAGSAAGLQGLVCKRDSSSNMMWQLMNNATHDYYVDFESQSLWNAISKPALVQGQWIHLAATHDGATGQLYINGALADTKAFTLGAQTGSTFYLGAVGTDLLTGVFNGAMDEIKVYNHVLEPAELAEEYYRLTGEGICLNGSRFDVSGPVGQPDCRVNLYDFAELAKSWLDCGLDPVDLCD